jgi:hypothetical protein
MIEEYPSPPEEGYLNNSHPPDISGENSRNDKITFRNTSNNDGNVSKFDKSRKANKKVSKSTTQK